MKVSVDVCPLCEGTGWKSVSIGSERRVTRCDCRRQARTQTLLTAARIPRRYEHCELSNFEFDGPHRALASARLNACFLNTACATAAGNLHRSKCGKGARNTSSGDPNSFNNRPDKREAKPGVSAKASQEREESNSIAGQPSTLDNYNVK